jgi:hypothetical protein
MQSRYQARVSPADKSGRLPGGNAAAGTEIVEPWALWPLKRTLAPPTRYIRRRLQHMPRSEELRRLTAELRRLTAVVRSQSVQDSRPAKAGFCSDQDVNGGLAKSPGVSCSRLSCCHCRNCFIIAFTGSNRLRPCGCRLSVNEATKRQEFVRSTGGGPRRLGRRRRRFRSSAPAAEADHCPALRPGSAADRRR